MVVDGVLFSLEEDGDDVMENLKNIESTYNIISYKE